VPRFRPAPRSQAALLRVATGPAPAEALELEPGSPLRLAGRRFTMHRPALVGAVLICAIALAVVIGPYVVPSKPDAVDLSQFQKGPSFSHLLGTDQAGRDVLARLVAGGRVSLAIGCLVALCSTLIGLTLGIVAGYFRGWVDFVVVRATEVILSFPGLVAVAAAAAAFGPSTHLLVIVLSLFAWPSACLIVRAMTLSARNLEYVTATRSMGASGTRIMVRHIVPAVLAPLTVFSTVAVAQAILAEAGLSFLGFGVQPPEASWGNMLNAAQSISVLTDLPWMWLPPGLAIAATVLSINLIGDGLRDAIDPRGGGQGRG
jgi:ABC-type dipeptide/oligopeptide/nickel transport system permease subunit